MRKPIIKDIVEFLEFLQKEDSAPENRTIKKIVYYTTSRENIDRIVELCKDGIYILEKEKESEITIGEKSDGTADLMTKITNGTFSITIEGIKFLEKHKEIKNQGELQKSQIFLTFALFTTAFFQGIVLMLYYHFDLKVRGFMWEAWILGGASVLILAFILIVFGKLRGKLIQ